MRLLAMYILGFITAFILFIIMSHAYAHDAPTGWSYPYACCSGIDCREVSGEAIGIKPTGYQIKRTGEIVEYSDTRIKDSPDGEYHWCSEKGADDSRTICLFVPPPSF